MSALRAGAAMTLLALLATSCAASSTPLDGGGVDGGGGDASADAAAPDASGPTCRVGSECNDDIRCTFDTCELGRCVHTADDTLCLVGQSCDVAAGGCASVGCDAEPCRAFPEPCGCGEGYQCAPVGGSTISYVCVPGGDRPAGALCTALGQCAVGTSCVPWSPTLGLCRTFCTSGTCSAPRSTCLIIDSAMGLGACTTGCSPVPNDCPSGTTCNFAGPDGLGTDCFPAGGSPAFGVCDPTSFEGQTRCGPGTTCLPDGLCRPICRVGTADCAAYPSATCLGFSTSIVLDRVEYGVCVLP